MPAFRLQETAAALEQQIRRNRLLDLPVAWSDDVIYPYYAGLALPNIMPSIAGFLGVPQPQAQPLLDSVWGDERPDIKIDRVVLFLMDGLGYQHLQQLIEADSAIAEAVSGLTDGRGAVPLTSVAPTTTAVALPSLWTGRAPAATGMLGTIMHLRELSLLGNMLGFKPTAGHHPRDVFFEWGIETEALIAVPGFSEHLQQHGIPTYVVIDKMLLGSSLGHLLHRGVASYYTHSGYSDMILRLEDALRATKGQRCYINVYWPAVDSIAHAQGAHNRYTQTEARTQLLGLQNLLQNPDLQDGRTLFVLVADHGHYDAPQIIDIMQDEKAAPIRDAMVVGLSGDNRLGYLYLRPGSKAHVKRHIETTFADCLAYIDLQDALDSGVFGNDGLAAQTRARLGDLILIPRLGWRVEDPSVGVLPLISWHGGLSDWEMLVPFLWQVF